MRLSIAVAMAVGVVVAILITLATEAWLLDRPDAPPDIIATLKTEEGFRATPYRDTRGYLTIGYGSRLDEELSPEETACVNHEDPPPSVTMDQADCLLRVHVRELQGCLERSWAFWRQANDWVRYALSLMGYQIGCHGVIGFHDMLAAIARGDTGAAARAALDSTWDKETPRRAELVVEALRASSSR